jgi:Zn-dependent peptidase ImmA (M78 family)
VSKVAVSINLLNWALERSGHTLADLERRFPKAEDWFAGEDQPTLRQLESLAKLTLTPLGYFFLEEPPEEKLPVPHFRTLGDREMWEGPSPELLQTIQTAQQRQAWMREFLTDQGQEPLPFVGSAPTDATPTYVGQSIRDTLGLPKRWAADQSTWTNALRFLRERMEEKGIWVVVNGIVGNNTHRKLDVDEFRGFVLVDDYAPLLFVNGADGKAAQMFTIAHELAHVFFGSSAAFDLREMQPASNPTEQACNKAAAEFLVPEEEIRRIWPSAKDDPEPFQVIARQFKISALVGARRALDLGLIGKHDFLSFYETYQKDERRKAATREEGGDFYATQTVRLGQRFARAVVRAAKEGKILYSDAYRLTGLHGKTFSEFAKSIGFRGA